MSVTVRRQPFMLGRANAHGRSARHGHRGPAAVGCGAVESQEGGLGLESLASRACGTPCIVAELGIHLYTGRGGLLGSKEAGIAGRRNFSARGYLLAGLRHHRQRLTGACGRPQRAIAPGRCRRGTGRGLRMRGRRRVRCGTAQVGGQQYVRLLRLRAPRLHHGSGLATGCGVCQRGGRDRCRTRRRPGQASVLRGCPGGRNHERRLGEVPQRLGIGRGRRGVRGSR
mmetsp:Transcript_40500/g.116418  ORF Transcript_40500/g.116418 Transcript_40500/m.116418 type:complete len:227 (+) Transcript_40500:151-831(+)